MPSGPIYYDSSQSSLDGYNYSTNNNNLVKRVGGAFKGGGTTEANQVVTAIGNASGVTPIYGGLTTALMAGTGQIGSMFGPAISGSPLGTPGDFAMRNEVNVGVIEGSSDSHRVTIGREIVTTGYIKNIYGQWTNSSGIPIQVLATVTGSYAEIVAGTGDTAAVNGRLSPQSYYYRNGGAITENYTAKKTQ